MLIHNNNNKTTASARMSSGMKDGFGSKGKKEFYVMDEESYNSTLRAHSELCPAAAVRVGHSHLGHIGCEGGRYHASEKYRCGPVR